MPTNPMIRLWNIDDIGVILLFSSGVSYLNQVGGFSCLQRIEEGVYVPIADDLIDQFSMLMQYFCDGPKWLGTCSNGIDIDDADHIDHILSLAYSTRGIIVDRTRLADSCEAWIYVDLVSEASDFFTTFNANVPHFPATGFGTCKGVLTWPNSD